jgi:DNA-binding transcriptional ArsR family regulator
MVESSPPRDKSAKRAKKSPVVLTDPRAIKALAHPARLAIIDEFFSGHRRLTATEAADIAGLSASAMSYHLRALERWGIIRRSESSDDGRERPWEAAGDGLRIDSAEPRATATGEAAMVARLLDRQREEALAWITRDKADDAGWYEVMAVISSGLWLTKEETRELSGELAGVLEQYEHRAQPEPRPGNRRIRVSITVVPSEHEPTPGGAAGTG